MAFALFDLPLPFFGKWPMAIVFKERAVTQQILILLSLFGDTMNRLGYKVVMKLMVS